MEFFWNSLIIPLLVLAPNLIWIFSPPINIPAAEEIKEPIALTMFENIGRFGVIIIPVFYPIVIDDENQYCLIGMVVLLLIYYAGWFRFYFRGRNYAYAFLPLPWIPLPIPMAASPVLYFILSAALLKSLLMLMAALTLGIGHILISYREYQRVKTFL